MGTHFILTPVAYLARKIARDIVLAGYADKCEVQLAYAIGVTQPVSVVIDCFGTELQDLDISMAFVKDSYNLTPRGILETIHLLDIDYKAVPSYGQSSKKFFSWEE